ncbi:MAG: GSCFA domain-containing protein [Burkholderiaceae bacterium]|nr:GSCFA domain-containing protein [Burkholderiaceae bacterium]
MHPYSDLPERHFWKRFVSNTPWRDLALGGAAKFRLTGDSKIATAGSCFAQHIARYLNRAGHSTYIAETPHPLVVEQGGETDSYKLFSARYGNIYTARQALELFKQAFGLVPMIEDFVTQDGRVYDLLRPNAVPEGFADLREARADRAWHLSRVRRMFETTDVFVFTLGLTECWYNVEFGHTYPVCPGTARGTYDPERYHFRNLNYREVAADLEGLVIGLREVNPALKLILTVSPVPLVATYTDNDVLVASSYSKSVLRAVCGEIDSRYNHVQYFPSYEIVSHGASFGQYLASDLREVTERGVAHVMSRFFATFFEGGVPVPANHAAAAPVAAAPSMAGLFEVECEEIFNDVKR